MQAGRECRPSILITQLVGRMSEALSAACDGLELHAAEGAFGFSALRAVPNLSPKPGPSSNKLNEKASTSCGISIARECCNQCLNCSAKFIFSARSYSITFVQMCLIPTQGRANVGFVDIFPMTPIGRQPQYSSVPDCGHSPKCVIVATLPFCPPSGNGPTGNSRPRAATETTYC